MPRLKLFLLGSPRVERDGTPLAVDTRKAIALVIYLAVTSESQGRDVLAALLWPEYDDTRAHAALRRTLSVLNKALAGEWLKTDRESVRLDRDAEVWVDVDEFRRRLADYRAHSAGRSANSGHPEGGLCLTCAPWVAEAAALYRDDFLAGFGLRDSPNFDDWQFFQAESLRRELAGALEGLARWHAAQGEYEPALAHARRWLALDPLHEPAHRYLMVFYAYSNQRAAALRQYRECVRILDEELGVPPLEETTRLYEAIKENRLEAETPGPQSQLLSTPLAPREKPDLQSFTSHSPPPLMGRAAEWAALLNAYHAIRADGRFIVLEGEAGIGKTYLAEAFAAHARSEGATILSARCYEGETHLAYGPFGEALRAAIGSIEHATRLEEVSAHWLSEAARLLPELSSLRPNLPPPLPPENIGAQSRFFEAIGQLLLALDGGPPPGLLFLDDVHWADEASLDLLTYLVRRLKGRPVCILAAWRGDQIGADHRLRQVLADAHRAGTGTVLSLSRLSQSVVLEMAQAALGSLPEPLGQRLYRETEGLPFFVAEYLAMMASDAPAGDLSGWSLPGGVRDLLRSRLAAVDDTGRQLLGTAAVIGRSFDFDTLREASGRSDEETAAALEVLIARGLVEEMGGAGAPGVLTYDFTHEKLRTLTYEETSLARRRLLHRRVAEALAARARSRPQPLGPLASQIAQHYTLAGREAEAAEYFKRAGEYARALYANAEALAHFQCALAFGHPAAGELHEALGDLQMLLGDYGAALTSYEKAAALSAPAALFSLEHKLGNVYQRRGQWEQAESHFRAALAALERNGQGTGADRERSKIYADWSLSAHQSDQADEALSLAHRAQELAEAAQDVRALAYSHNLLGILARSRDDLDLARDHLERSLGFAEALKEAGVRVAALNNLALVYEARGDTEQALKLTETALAQCVAQGDRHREAALHNHLADLLHAAGQAEAAMAHLKQAVTIFAEIGAEAEATHWQPEIWKLTEW